MPTDALAIAGHLAEIMRAPANDVFTQQVPDDGDNARSGKQIINRSVFQMSRADRITVAARRRHLRKQAIKVTPMRCHLGFIKNTDRADEAVAIKRINLLTRKQARIFNRARMKIQITLELIQFVILRNGFELHRSDLLLRFGRIVRHGFVMFAQQIRAEVAIEVSPDRMNVIAVVLCVVVFDQESRPLQPVIM